MNLIFDFDGTLHNTSHIYGLAVREVCAALTERGRWDGCLPSDEELKRYLGVPAPEMWADFAPGLTDGERDAACREVGAAIRANVKAGHAEYYDGILPMLEELHEKGHALLVLSHCDNAYMDTHRAAAGLDRFFAGYYCTAEYGYASKAEVMKILLAEHPGAGVMSGDRESDIRAGAANGIPAIACAYGFGQDEEYGEASRIVRSPAELRQVLLEMPV